MSQNHPLHTRLCCHRRMPEKPYKFFRTAVLPIMASICIACNDNPTLTQFNSDGCSAFPDGTITHNTLWLQCCTAHDLAYWQGGTYDQRLIADLELEQCVTQVGEKEIAQLMLAGVRVGGTPYLPTPFRWGYGWSYPRFYRELTSSEKDALSETDPSSAPTQ